MHRAPNHEFAYIQEATLCRCRTCVRHSWWARRRLGDRAVQSLPPPQLELTTLPPFAGAKGSSEDRRRLRRIHHDNPASILCICSCYSCIGHRTLDYAAQSVTSIGRLLVGWYHATELFRQCGSHTLLCTLISNLPVKTRAGMQRID